MSTRLSKLFVRTLREDPVDAEVASHRLLVRAGYIRRQAPGIFAWLPLGLRVKNKVEAIVREEMERIGAQEVHFPALLPAEPYQATGRYDEYGPGMFRLEDRKRAPMVLAPTHEEFFALLVKDLYSSYKDLPLSIYQIQDKYRDEARPRAGILRGREFTMKDAYSFDHTDAGLAVSYQAQRDAYERIFQRLGLEYVIVAADAGAMGGSKSEEFLHPTPIGEDTFVRSPGGYAANVEAFTTLVPESIPIEGQPAARVFDSPDTPTIQTLVDLANAREPREDGRAWTAADTLKNIVLALTHLDGTRELVVVGIPGDRDIDLKRAEVAFFPAEVEAANDGDLAKNPGLVKGYIGPWSPEGPVLGSTSSTKVRYVVDPRVVDGSSWITGANVAGKHVLSLVAGRDFTPDGVVEAADVRDGDPAPDGSGPISTARGTEIGHVFELGRKYAEALGLKVLDENGKLVTVTMGSYGIGITRNLALVAEATQDGRGLLWPASISPFDVHVVMTGKDPAVGTAAEELVDALDAAGLDVLFDDRPKVSPGVKFGDAELIGVPTVVIVGRGAVDGMAELWDRRTNERTPVALADVAGALTAAR
ncbi:proline--tRNA ligase [Clavibacter sepedonicus]|uniref:Proline--tRNA ligase n=1 Tax=Clavibacter sepedonicus TaxID=31964 RepID=SYP_CLASE|nr:MULTISPECIES: proline--tRNA ligase [Clavibacter]B0RDZ1.1 RecName: Full=Proline--tRNA ligase; AltName: Full=Prolyl-tRNA synthetase; Short=ProRS [Clavibacter sepedonicus]MBD5382378.1 proline--tRNA ligase [Clavibacter sp.]OQJ47599.1 proline--tRNA ligase [Clavibacter sepedonicus]OQJ53154.1 proline--tRNA ligase [Clavibacter sepedonicus]UUK64311.1 proline--tRNA ligase [Clavibacter sepedonicus]CAQ01950.1 prolyl tRNA synthetase [Clavibacter sepedonicus]